MAVPQIKIDQSGKSAGTGGQSRSDLAVGVQVVGTDSANGAGNYAWEFVRPADSSSTASGLDTDTVTFTPDVTGTYLLFLTFNTTFLSYTEDSLGQKVSTQGGAGVKTTAGDRIPGVGETLQFGGWAAALTEIIKRRSVLKEEDSVVAGSPFTTLNFKALGGATISVVDAGSGEATVTISGSA